MLQTLRSGAKGRTAKVLFTILILSFVLWGVGPILQSAGGVRPAAVVGEIKIPQAQVEGMLQEGLRRIQAQSGTTPSPDMVEKIVRPSLVRQLVAAALFDQEANRVGLRVGETLIRQTIAAEPGFRDEKGNFSKQRYLGLLQAVGLTEADYIRSLQQDVSHGALRGLVAAGTQPSVEVVKLAEAYSSEKRTVEAVEVPFPKAETVPAPTNEELTDFYNKNSERYRAPEYRNFSYLMLDVAKIADAVKPTDADIQNAYDENKSNYMAPEQRDLLVVTTSRREVAEKLSTDAQAQGFEAAAKAASLPVQTLKDMTKEKTMSEMADAAFALGQGETSGALASGPAWSVVSIAAIKPATQMSFEDAKKEITTRLSADAAEKSIQESLRNLEDTIAGGATLVEASQMLNQPLVKVENVAQTGLHKDGTKITDATVLRDILPIAFATGDGENSPPHDLPTGMMVLHVDGVTDSQIKPLDEVKAQVETGWKRARQAELAQTKAKEMADSFKADGTLAGTAKVGPIDRSGNGRGKLPNEAVTGLFGLAGGDVMTVDDADGTWVIKVTEITNAPAKAEDIASLTTTLKQDMAQERYTTYGQALWRHYGVTVAGKKMVSPVE